MKYILAFIACIASAFGVYADQIVTRDADVIDCKVVSVNDMTVTYTKNGETFNREIPRGDVFKIKYDNGDEEMITISHGSQNNHDMPVSIPTKPDELEVTEPDWYSMPPASKDYHIGDWYSENGVEGIVIWTTSDGRHGRLLYPKKFNHEKFKLPLAFFTGDPTIPIGMHDRANGYTNWEKLQSFRSANPQFGPEMFPIPTQIESLGAGWYLPSIGELVYLSQLRDTEVTYQGEHSKFNGKTVKWSKVLNHVSKQHGGHKHDEYYSLSSSELYSKGGATALNMGLFGDPREPQFCLLKLEDGTSNLQMLPIIRHLGKIPYYAFHLF